jgi:hypothetical protein
MRAKLRELATRARRLLTVLTLVLAGGDAWAAGGKPATKLVNVANTHDAHGISLWVANIYNSSMWLYGLLVVVTMVLMGLVLGFACDRMMGLLGIDLGRMQHHE